MNLFEGVEKRLVHEDLAHRFDTAEFVADIHPAPVRAAWTQVMSWETALGEGGIIPGVVEEPCPEVFRNCYPKDHPNERYGKKIHDRLTKRAADMFGVTPDEINHLTLSFTNALLLDRK